MRLFTHQMAVDADLKGPCAGERVVHGVAEHPEDDGSADLVALHLHIPGTRRTEEPVKPTGLNITVQKAIQHGTTSSTVKVTAYAWIAPCMLQENTRQLKSLFVGIVVFTTTCWQS